MSMEGMRWPIAGITATMLVVASGCGDEEVHVGSECSTEAIVIFQGRTYTQGVDAVDRDAEGIKGERLGMGELPASCTDLDGEGEKVVVFKLVGVRADRGVYVDPPFGPMGRVPTEE